ncbi:MAG TPA: phosphatase PAP2 family protein [Cyclobacteriaceae bacterium]|nr:phosphatase PAP2 family protein [Cyclobacteriaceae bacterium]
MVRAILLFVSILSSQSLWCQSRKPSTMDNVSPEQKEKIYKTHPVWEIPSSLALIGAASLGYKWMDKRASLTAEQAVLLNPLSINSFDRPAAYYDPATFQSAASKSDIMMTAFVASPLLLVFDKKIRRDWADMLGMLLVAHAADNTVFFSTILLVRRPRPLTYNPALSIEDKTGVGKTNSFPSGHVSWTATSTFFIAKVYTDYHHIKGWKRVLFYTGAAFPPTLIGYYRVHAGRHFSSDAIVGGLLGAACGIAIPELHRISKKVDGLSVKPFFMNGSNGLSVSYVFK